MVKLQMLISGGQLGPVDTNGATTSGTAFDTAQITNALGPSTTVMGIFRVGNIAASTTTLIIEEATEDTFASPSTVVTFTNLTGSDDNKAVAATINIGGNRLRYLRWKVTGGAGATVVCGEFLALPTGITPDTAAKRGFAQFQTV